jgi:hypothetical protein
MATDTAPAPEHFIVSPQDGSAYYLIAPTEQYPNPELVQVPLDTEGNPIWEEELDGSYGGGAVDWDRAFEDTPQGRRTRDRLRIIEGKLRERMGL